MRQRQADLERLDPAIVFTVFVRCSHRKRNIAETQSTGANQTPAQLRLQN